MTTNNGSGGNDKWRALLLSRAFWAALFGLVVMLLEVLLPGFPLSADQLAPVAALLAAFILGEALEGAPAAPDARSALVGLLASRKFWAALIGMACITLRAFRPDFALDEAAAAELAALLSAYILGVGLTDRAHRNDGARLADGARLTEDARGGGTLQ